MPLLLEIYRKAVTLTSISPLGSISYASSVRRASYVAELIWIFCARIQNRALEKKDSPIPRNHTPALLLYQPSASTSPLEKGKLRKKHKGEGALLRTQQHCTQMSAKT